MDCSKYVGGLAVSLFGYLPQKGAALRVRCIKGKKQKAGE